MSTKQGWKSSEAPQWIQRIVKDPDQQAPLNTKLRDLPPRQKVWMSHHPSALIFFLRKLPSFVTRLAKKSGRKKKINCSDIPYHLTNDYS